MAVLTVNDPEDLALGDGQVVCSTFVPDPEGEYMLRPSTGGDLTPHRAVYFAGPAYDDDRVAEMAFEIQNGRPMEPYQRWAMNEAKRA